MLKLVCGDQLRKWAKYLRKSPTGLLTEPRFSVSLTVPISILPCKSSLQVSVVPKPNCCKQCVTQQLLAVLQRLRAKARETKLKDHDAGRRWEQWVPACSKDLSLHAWRSLTDALHNAHCGHGLRKVALCQRQTPFHSTAPLQVWLTLKALSGNLLCHAFILFQLAESFLLEVGLKEE